MEEFSSLFILVRVTACLYLTLGNSLVLGRACQMQSLKCQEFYDAVTCHTWNTLELIFDKLLSVLDLTFRVLSFRSISMSLKNVGVLENPLCKGILIKVTLIFGSKYQWGREGRGGEEEAMIR